MRGEGTERPPGLRNEDSEKERRTSVVSTESSSSMASIQSFNSGMSDSYSNGNNAAPQAPKNHLQTDSNPAQTNRRRSHSFGRNTFGSLDSGVATNYPNTEEHNKHFRSLTRHRPRSLAQGPLYQILNNFKSFSRDSKDYFRGEHPHRTDSSVTSSSLSSAHSPSNSPPSSHRSQRSVDSTVRHDAEETIERGRNSDRSDRHYRDRSVSPSFRRKLPSLSTLVPSSNDHDHNSNGVVGGGSSGGGARNKLARPGWSNSRTNTEEAQIEGTQAGSSSAYLTPPLQNSGTRRRSSSSASAIKSHIAAAGEALFSIAAPSLSSSTTHPTPANEATSPISPHTPGGVMNFNPHYNIPNGSSSNEVGRLRHAELPQAANSAEEEIDADTSDEGHTLNRKSSTLDEKPSFLRVFRSDGTFGTIACPLDISADRLLKLAARKFFINNAEEYHLVAVKPSSLRILSPDAKPVKLIRNLLIHAGYHSSMDRLNDVCREDTSFVCRIVLANRNEPLRPPLLMQGMRELVLVNTDVVDAPGLACQDPRHVDTIDVSRSAFQGTSTVFPRLRHLRMSRMFLPDEAIPTLLEPRMKNLMANLTMLDLSGNRFTTLDGVDFMAIPLLTHLNLRGNQLVELPTTLMHMPYLENLNCGTNALTHFEIWNPSLQKIDLSYNNLSRLVLSQHQALQMVNLGCLQLSANSLDTLPEGLHSLPMLRELDVRHNLILNPLDAMTFTLTRLIASYNNPRTPPYRNSSTSSRELHEVKQVGMRSLPQMEKLKLEGLNTLEIHETFNMGCLTHLDMRNTHMPYVHESLFRNTPNLKVLNLSNNSLTRLPSSIRDLRLLEELYVANNSLVDLPAELFELPEVRILDAHANNLEHLPLQMLTAPKLRILNLASNLITSLPSSSMPNISCSLLQLTLCDNQLNEDCFKVILQMTALRVLDLSYNFITEIPSGVFSQLPSLEELYLGGNRILTLPHDDFAYATQLRVLAVNGNKLHTIPAELSKAVNLEVFDAAANQLRYNVANWPFDWNWRWNKKLRYLNFSSNRRLEIRKSLQFVDEETGVVDLADLCVLPNLNTLGLIDVTLTTNSVPFQTENCRVRTFGSDLQNFRVGIAETLGNRPLANNDLVVENFRGKPDEFLVAIFDGHGEYPGNGNRISNLARDTFAALLKQEMQVKDTTTVDALRRAFLITHREIGNTALLSPEEIAHTPLGHRSSSALRLGEADWSSGTGATVLYFQGSKIYVATVGGARVVVSRSNGTHTVLSKPLPPASAELDRIRAAGGYVDPNTSYVNGTLAHPRLIGCYTAGTVISAAPSIYEYDSESLDVTDQILIGSSAMWDVMRHETAADIVRSSSQYPVLAAMKLKDFALAYGCRDRMMALVIGRPWSQTSDDLGRQLSAGDIYDEELASYRKRRQDLPEDSTLARLGTEISPPTGEVTMVFTDIKNSTYLWESYPGVMRAAIKTHNSLMRRSIRLMDGYEVKNEGDAFIVSFHTPVKALIWCLTVQQHLITAEWPPELLEIDGCSPVHDSHDNIIFCGLSVRMGIHCGRPVAEPDPVTRRMDYFGPMVNRASRISGMARGGQISVSADFLNMLNRDLEPHYLVKQGKSIDEAYTFANATLAAALERSAVVLDNTEYVIHELGELKLRGIENPEHIYNIYPAVLATRQAFYDENNSDEGPSHELQPVIESIERNSQNVSRFADNQNLMTEVTLGGNVSNIADRDPAVTASLGLPSLASLTGISTSGTTSASAPGTPVSVPADIEERRYSEGLSLPPAHFSRTNENLENHDSHRKLGLHSKLSRQSELLNDSFSFEDEPRLNERLQLLSRRLETLCLAISGDLRLQPLQELLDFVDPPMDAKYETAPIARLLWLTRIENSIARLQQIQKQQKLSH